MRSPRIQLVHATSQSVGRVTRSPRHPFAIKQDAWEITPFFIAPVLPGETMTNLLCQSVVRGKPLNAARVGWWYEMFFFYVKHRDIEALMDADYFTAMHLTAGQDLTAIFETARDPKTYFHTTAAAGRLNWVRLCLDTVVSHYFRNEGEEVYDFATPAALATDYSPLPLASVVPPGHNSIWDSAKLASAVAPETEELPGETEDDPLIPPGFEAHYAQWESMVAQGVVNATFEDYLATFGVNVPKEKVQDVHKPELIRYIRDFQIPKFDTVENDYTPQWNLAERADKDRFCKEPGFLFGVSVARPKVFLGHQASTFTQEMSNAFSWLPAVLSDVEYTSLKEIAGNTVEGPLVPETGEPYWVDLRDLLVHGEQFVNFIMEARSEAGVPNGLTDDAKAAGVVALPTPTLHRRYAVDSDFGNLWKGATAATKGLRADGVVTLNIKTRITDTTPNLSGLVQSVKPDPGDE